MFNLSVQPTLHKMPTMCQGSYQFAGINLKDRHIGDDPRVSVEEDED